ncbi:MAG: hypothetical protein ACYDER_16600 [Ktedonobacteraceae bacterium]
MKNNYNTPEVVVVTGASAGAHGTFDDKASYTSKQLWVDMHAGSLALVGLGLAGIATFAALTRRLR